VSQAWNHCIRIAAERGCSRPIFYGLLDTEIGNCVVQTIRLAFFKLASVFRDLIFIPINMNSSKCTRRDVLRLGANLTVATAVASSLSSRGLIAQSRIAASRDFDIMDFGAVGDGKTLDSAAIQRAVDAAFGAGGGRVIVGGGRQYLIGTVELKSGIEFHLANDAELLVSTDESHYTGRAAINAQGVHGLRITGTGRINGRSREFMTHFDAEDEWWRPKDFRPRLIVLTECKDIELHNFSIFEAPSWSVHFVGCERVLVDGLKIRNQLDVPNCDGIDPDHCRDVEIRNCHIVCGDDAIVVKAGRRGVQYGGSSNIHVHDCILETQDSGVKIGTETTADIHDILFERCQIISSCRACTIQLRDEGDVYNVDFRDITFVTRYHSDPWWGRGEAISITAIPRTKETQIGACHDIRVENVSGRAENSVRINGSKESRIQNVSLKNVDLTLDRWTRYPGGLFDNRPTSAYPDIEPHGNPGFSIRHADNVTLENCSLAWGGHRPDYYTHALEASDVTNLQLTNFRGTAAHPEWDEAIVIR
jgi:hypothetical protein